MQKSTLIKLAFASMMMLFISACSNTAEKVVATPSPQPAQTEKRSSTWQQAYGESLESKENKLGTAPTPYKTTIGIDKPVTDVWERIRDGFLISDHESLHADTEQQLKWFITHPDYVNRVVERARPYLYHIVEQIEARNMPMEIALLPVVESGFKPYAYSHGRASGLWQFIPGTGKLYGLDQNWWYDGRRDVIESTRAALDYLQKLYNDFGDWQLALAAYNCGEGTVGRAIKRNQQLGRKTDFWSLDLPRETSAYVPKLLAVSHMVKNPARYDISLSPIENKPYLTIVDVGSQIDLALAAKMAGITTEKMYQLNPGYNRWATMPDGPHKLVVPIANERTFKQALSSLPESARIKWARHQIKSGESLSTIARRYNTTIAVIKDANDIVDNNIRAGHHLLIPVASGKQQDYVLSESQRLAALVNAPEKKTKKTIHTVKNGDTWWDIARRHGININTLAKWNGKAPGDILKPGQQLVIWTNQATASNPGGKLKTVFYTIRDGDSLWGIAKKFNVSVSQVREWNELTERTLIQPGQNLTLYVDVTQQYDQI